MSIIQSILNKIFPTARVEYKSDQLTPIEIGERIHNEGKSTLGEFTMYNPVRAQTDETPTIMASGKKIYDGAIATGDRGIPFGTRIYIPELKKVFTVEDRMNKRYMPSVYGKNTFDIPTATGALSDIDRAKKFGRQQLHFVVIGHDGRKQISGI
jgi:hypothetical protein